MIIQTSGLSGEISSVRIINPQIYIAIPCQKVYIPRSILELEPFLNILESLIGLVEKMEEMAVLVTKSSLFLPTEDFHLENILEDHLSFV